MCNQGSKMTQTSLWRYVYLHTYIQVYVSIYISDLKISPEKKKVQIILC